MALASLSCSTLSMHIAGESYTKWHSSDLLLAQSGAYMIYSSKSLFN